MRLLLGFFGLLALVSCFGCGSLSPCGGADFGTSNPGYMGSYTGTLHKSNAVDLHFTLDIKNSGVVTGSVVEEGSGRSASVTGQVTDENFACSKDTTALETNFTFDGEAARRLVGERGMGQEEPWSFSASYYEQNGQHPSAGTLVLNRVVG